MTSVCDLGSGLGLVDSTEVLDSATESRGCHLVRYNTGDLTPDLHTALDLTAHLGAHCECPYHHFKDGKSVGELPLTTSMGRAIYVNIDFLEPNSHISAVNLDRACGDCIREGGIVILDDSWKFPPFTSAVNSSDGKRLLISAESAQWFCNHKVKCVGFGDGISIEDCSGDVKPLRDILMEVDIIFLKVLKSPKDLIVDTFFVSYTPLPPISTNSVPVCTYTIEGLPGFTT